MSTQAKRTYAELELLARQRGLELDRVTDALQAVVNDEVQWFKRAAVDGTRFAFGVAGLTRAHGGLLLVKSSVKQPDGKWDRNYTVVYLLDDARMEQEHAHADEYRATMLAAIYEAMRMRDRAHITATKQSEGQSEAQS